MNPCDHLDDYLAHDLIGDDRDRFIAHLQTCERCSAEVAECQTYSKRLSQASQLLEPCPIDLTRASRRKRLWIQTRYYGAIAASILAMAVTLSWMALTRTPKDDVGTKLAKKDVVGPKLTQTNVRVSLPTDSRKQIVQLESEQPNVTVFWVFSNPKSPAHLKRDAQ